MPEEGVDMNKENPRPDLSKPQLPESTGGNPTQGNPDLEPFFGKAKGDIPKEIKKIVGMEVNRSDITEIPTSQEIISRRNQEEVEALRRDEEARVREGILAYQKEREETRAKWRRGEVSNEKKDTSGGQKQEVPPEQQQPSEEEKREKEKKEEAKTEEEKEKKFWNKVLFRLVGIETISEGAELLLSFASRKIRGRVGKWAEGRLDQMVDSTLRKGEKPSGKERRATPMEGERDPSWTKGSWKETWERLRGHVAQGKQVGSGDKDLGKDLKLKTGLVRAAEEDGYINNAYQRAREAVGEITVGREVTDEEIDSAWKKLNSAFLNINPDSQETESLGRWSTEEMRNKYYYKYGGLHDAYAEYLGNEVQLALMRAERQLGMRGLDDAQIKELQRKQDIMRFGPIPAGIGTITTAYARLEKKQIDDAIREAQLRASEQRGQGQPGYDTEDTQPVRVGRRGAEDNMELPWPNMGWVDEDFLKKRGIKERYFDVVYQNGQTAKVDMIGYMEQVFIDGNPQPGWMNDAGVVARVLSEFESGGWEKFIKGVVPWIKMWYQNNGSYKTLVDPGTKEGLAGDLSLFYTAAAFEKDEKAKQCLAMFLQMNNAQIKGKRVIDIPDMAEDEKRWVRDNLEGEFVKMMKVGHLDVEGGIQVSRGWMEEIAQKVADHVGCGKGTALVMAEMATVLNGTPKMNEYRKLQNKYPFLFDDPDEKIARPMLAQVFVGLKPEGGSVFLADYLNSGGVDGLFAAMKERTNPVRLAQAITARARVISTLEKAVDFAEAGDDDFKSINERRANKKKAINEGLINDRPVRDITLKTQQIILDRKVYGENLGESKWGKNADAKLSAKENLRNIFGDFKDSL